MRVGLILRWCEKQMVAFDPKRSPGQSHAPPNILVSFVNAAIHYLPTPPRKMLKLWVTERVLAHG